MKRPKLKEIAPGEIRTVCWTCGTPISSRACFCEEHADHKQKLCEKCGKGTKGTICAECRKSPEEKKLEIPGGRRLTEQDRPVVEKLWEQGVSASEIASTMGLLHKHPGTMITEKRKKGWDLPYRRDRACIESMRALGRKRNATNR